MSNLPEQVQRQVDEAEAVLNSLKGDTPADTPATPAQGAEVTPSNVASVQPATTPDDQNSETYAQRWRSLQGIHNTTLRRGEALANRVAQLEHILSTLQQQPSQQPSVQQPSNTYVTEKDRADYGDSVDVMRRVAREEFSPVIAQLQQTINNLGQNVSSQVQQVRQSQTLTQADMFYQKLKQVVPEWEQVNASPEFQSWLSEIDPQTGIQRQIYLNDAHSRWDVDRVAYIFRQGSGRQQQAASAPNSTQTVTNSAASQLELQVAPGKTRVTSNPTGQNQAKTYARSDISKFYDDYRRGLYRGKEAEYAQIEQDIVAASREGRIVAG